MNMVIKTIKRHIEINTDFLKLMLRNMRKDAYCPMCEKHVSKIRAVILCNKCDDLFSNYSERKKKRIIKKARRGVEKSDCFLCRKKNLKLDNKLHHCVDCGVSFHL